jgi:RNA polymerase sigma factor (sigma-70 family)
MATAELGSLRRHIHRLATQQGGAQRTDGQLLNHFAACGDEGAFADLVARHGPMVLRVCRRVLRHEQDAEDAFQATFLVLARNTRSIHRHDTLASWLYGVAFRTALKAKRSAARRRNHEAQLQDGTPRQTEGPTWDEVQSVLDEEIQRLPDAYRAAFVLCAVEGKSGPEAAAELGVKPGTVWSRLTRARYLLQRRLTCRGIKLAALLAALSVAASASRAAVPAALAQATIRFGPSVAAGHTAAAMIPSQVAALAAGVTKAMFLTKTKIVLGSLLVVGLFVGAGVVAHQAVAAKGLAAEGAPPENREAKPGPAAGAAAPQPPATGDKGLIAYSGRVIGPDGRPARGAKIYLTPAWSYLSRPYTPEEHATTEADGRFHFTVPRAKFHEYFTVVTATMAICGPGWVEVPTGGKRDDLTLQLVKDDVPITGQIVDLQGKPVPGATVSTRQISAAPGEDLAPWLEAVKDKGARSFDLEKQYLKRYTIGVNAKTTTDADGHFRLTGIGRNRLVILRLEGPGITSELLHVLTRPGGPTVVTEFEGKPEYNDPRRLTTYYGANFKHAAAPSRPIIGIVRDKETKRPLSGITIRSLKLANSATYYMAGQESARTTTDTEGRYRLTGMPKGEGNKIEVAPPDDLPYIAVASDVPDPAGLAPVTVDIELKRGVWIEGKITNKVTGKPLKGGVEYLPLFVRNPNIRDYPGFGYLHRYGTVDDDGHYRVLGLPGPGMVAVYNPENYYLRAQQRDDEYGSKRLSDEECPMHVRGSNCGALTRVSPVKGARAVQRDITLDPGWRLTGTVLGPDGKPLAGTRSFLLIGHWWETEATRTADFAAWFNPHETKALIFQHLEKGLVGMAEPPKENGGAITVRLGRGALISGRLIDTNGKPMAGVALEVQFKPKGWGSWFEYVPDGIKTDAEGRFRAQALAPGAEYRLTGARGQAVIGTAGRAGETTDLGDIVLVRKAE